MNENKLKRIIFLGTPEFAVPTLRLLCESKYKPVLVISQPDRYKGRNRKILHTEVKKAALEYGAEVYQPEDINSSESIEYISSFKPDLAVTVAYGGYLKKKMRKLPVFGCINLHPSLLPEYRGSSPLNFSLFNGDEKTGITVFKIIGKMDAGPVYKQINFDILPNENYTSLYKRTSETGAKLVLEVLDDISENKVKPLKQNHEKATFSFKLEKEDLILDWHQKAKKIQNRVRGLADVPGITASFRNKTIKILEVELIEKKSCKSPGTVIETVKNKGITVTTEDFDVLITKVKPQGKNIMTAHAFHLGAKIKPGEVFF